ncbi:MAG: hypothetical protein BAJALOKI2v1_530020 [Promethearchaeota archaeon]|nr:MAG: hypothetical protein BAJALOKI2v1_530020 [Candidatus Lokiarchaeota archaeon]
MRYLLIEGKKAKILIAPLKNHSQQFSSSIDNPNIAKEQNESN